MHILLSIKYMLIIHYQSIIKIIPSPLSLANNQPQDAFSKMYPKPPQPNFLSHPYYYHSSSMKRIQKLNNLN